ncbi:endonuclease/exonuclease/phosphatase family protein [Uliginosibacterium sp. H3]|uniref:Endonuclease/exonuclease/phosphatase family protein n=1 Tax=Uliginosibacterium silvisoli TaxID=3114758 RepID=A0ABU6K0V2_9RHOO|nr:endonuclease/exonuclease/phosphatase family protein [Uliginosibacterium sp. H3]
MRLASFNVENLFNRAKAMNLESRSEGKPVLEKFAKLNELLAEDDYSDTLKQRMINLMIELGLEKSDEGPFVILRQNRGGLVKRPRTGGLQIVASGRTDWVGSLDLIQAPVDEEAMRNTARVMMDLQADVLAVVEAESRPALSAFNTGIVGGLGGIPFAHVMLIDGNDSRGIDVGLMTRESVSIGQMRSHVDDRGTNGQLIFSRDCPEFELLLPSRERFLLLVNHLKSKGFGTPAASSARRRLQAERVKAIYEELRGQGEKHIAIVGDFNDTPDSQALDPLLKGTDLRDAFEHPSFDDGGFPGTFGSCTAANKIDYLLLSPELFEKVTAGGVLRKGLWPGVRPKRWDVFAEVTKPVEAASDHAAVWVDLDI